MYARDTSKKIRATWQNKGRSEHLTVSPPYGYKKDLENPKLWVVDEEAAAVVQKIFYLCMNGMGTTQISGWLRDQKILCPTAYHLENGRKGPHKPPKTPYRWTVQNIRQGRRRLTKTGEADMFSGLVFCPDCANRLYRTKKYNGRDTHFYSCATYHADSIERECSAHYIGNLALEEIVLRNLREAIAYVSKHENDFIRELTDASIAERDKELARSKTELAKAEKRITELDDIIKHLYEDNISGKLTDERFIKLSGDYEHEQEDLRSLVDTLNKSIMERVKKKTDAKNFVAVTKKYTDLQELDAAVLREFIERIYVSEKDKHAKTQEVQIVYNFIGAFDFTQAAELQTRNRKSTGQVGKAGVVSDL